jgi:hypothetical protein
MPEILTAGAEEFALASELVAQATGDIADNPVRVVVLATRSTLEEARDRVHNADVAERRRAAKSVASQLGGAPDVAEVWLIRDTPELIVALVVDQVTLDRELELRAIFADLTHMHEAELRIYSDSEGRADFARKGERLLG